MTNIPIYIIHFHLIASGSGITDKRQPHRYFFCSYYYDR